MANKIKPKRSYTANAVPTTSDLDTNELAINWADSKAFTKNAAGNIVSVTLGGGGSSSIVTASTVAGFPATGTAGILYVALDTSKVFQWQGAYLEVGAAGGNIAGSVAIPGLGDSSYSSVSLLLHGNGNLTDKSSSPKTVTAIGSAAVSTTQAKFGTGSLASLSAGDFYSVPNSSDFDFGSGNFTIEMWVYPVSGNSGIRGLFGKRSTTNVGPLIAYIDSSGALTVNAANTSATGGNWTVSFTSSTTVSNNQWTYIAVVRNGTTLTAYINGTSVGSSTSLGSAALLQNSSAFTIGSTITDASYTPYFGGYMDEIRVTKGVARTVTTVPTAAFDDGTALVVPVVYS